MCISVNPSPGARLTNGVSRVIVVGRFEIEGDGMDIPYNALLLPIVIGFLLPLGWKVLPEKYRLHRWEKSTLLAIYVLLSSLAVFTIFIVF